MPSGGERGWKHSCQLDSENQINFIHYLIKSLWLQTQPAHSEDSVSLQPDCWVENGQLGRESENLNALFPHNMKGICR